MSSAMDLAPAIRNALAQRLIDALTAQCPGSRAGLRGSLARGTADAYSDIDLAWTVPDAEFDACAAGAGACLARVREVASLRSDPDLQRSRGRRLLFVAFRDLPLFWRLDLEISAESAAGDPDHDRGNPQARGDDWSPAASALANAVAAVKAVLRHQPDTARGLLERGLRRVGAPGAVSGRWPEDVARLARAAAGLEPEQRPLADRVVRLADELLPRHPAG
ncbi:nucleotidyltransferase domain-containing protein [Streptomyces sp. NBC_00344]|uniref:nucleotidyltransferase domain-containing protein n=1 Tax=Streptomyces sp. NBC_00344 TaxID=2975720 RepID=UPI002E24B257